MKAQIYFVLFFTLLNAVAAFSQSEELGMPFIKNYPIKKIKLPRNKTVGTQFWAVAQDADGRFYFGNSAGILVYDGNSWDVITASNKTVIRSIVVAKNTQKIYVGAQDDFGYLKADAVGNLQFKSLVEKIPEGERKFGNVWKIYATAEGVFFQTFSHVFLWKDEVMKIYKPKSSFHLSFYTNKKFIVLDRKNGLYTLENDSLKTLPSGDYFIGKRVYAALPYGENEIIFCSRENGLLHYKNNKISPFVTDVDTILKKAQVYNGIRLPNNTYAIATIRNGLIHLDSKGKTVRVIDKETGLQDNGIFALMEDKNGGVWAGMNNGIARISLNSPISMFNEKNGIKGKGQSVIRHQGKIFVGTSLGLFEMEGKKKEVAGKTANFKAVSEINTVCWELMNINKGLLIAASQGLYFMRNGEIKELVKGYALKLNRSLQDSNRVYVGTINGVLAINYKNGKWETGEKIEGIKGQISGVQETKDQNLWVSARNRGVFKIAISEGYDAANPKMSKYKNGESGLSPTGSIVPYDTKLGLIFSTDKGYYRFNKEKNSFYPDTTLGIPYSEELQLSYRLDKDRNGNLWRGINNDPVSEAKYNTDGSISWIKTPYLTLPPKSTRQIYPEENGTVWLPNVEGLYRFDNNVNYKYDIPFKALIKNVRLLKSDSLIFGGYNFNQKTIPLQKIAYQFNAIHLEFSAPTYPNEEQTLFRYQLQGFDKQWSQWKTENKKEFTNLPAGDYTFKVQAKNIYEFLSEEASYSFVILSPWYQTIWAYFLFSILFVGIIYSSVKYYNRRLQAENEKLESIVSSRTAQLRQEKKIVEDQKEEIEVQKDNLETQKNEVEKAYNNITVLSEIGRKITATLNTEAIIFTVYDYINTLMDASAFGIGIFNGKTKQITFEGFIEKGEKIPYHYDSISDENSLAVWCFKNEKEIFINDLIAEYQNYIPSQKSIEAAAGEIPKSLIYLPLLFENKCIGVITVQSFNKKSYSARDITILSTLASYIVIALDNAKAYDIIQIKNKNITSSIKYAETIQKAILPSVSTMKKYLEDVFVLYKPKDIVSGDFYWASAIENEKEELEKVVIAVADCTGHGVPGAFMSMISSTLINEIVNIKRVHQPELILELLDELVRKALDQDNSKNQDGMDITLCIIEKQENGNSIISFAGAKRPLLFSTPDGLKTIKGTSRGIGGIKKNTARPFVGHQITVEKGTICYLFSDGIIDQSNPERKRFGSVKLKKLLEEVCSKPFNQQQELIEKTLSDYQKDADQRDDIALLGIQI